MMINGITNSGPRTPERRWDSDEHDSIDLSVLNERLRFPYASNIIAKNRIMKSAMSEQMASYDIHDMKKSGIPTPELLHLYENFADGGFGITVTGCIMVNGKDIEAPGNVIIDKELDSEERRKAFKDWTEISKRNGSIFIAQLFHPGKYAANLPHKTNFDVNNLTVKEIGDLINEYAYAASFAQQCGFNGVEISCAYFFALGQLITSGANTRKDEFGGLLDNRAKILFKIIQAIRMKISRPSSFVIGLKLFCGNFEPAFNDEQFGEFVHNIEKTGFDYITITGGHYNLLKDLKRSDEPKKCEYFYQQFVLHMKNHLTRTKLFMNGGFVTLADMCAAVRNGWAAGVALGRPVAAEPDLPKRMLNEEVKGAVKSLFDPLDYAVAQQFAGAQLWQHGMMINVMDASNPDHVEHFKKDLHIHEKEKAAMKGELNELIVIGYPKTVINPELLDPELLQKIQRPLATTPVTPEKTETKEGIKETTDHSGEQDHLMEEIHHVVKKQLDHNAPGETVEDTLYSVVQRHEKLPNGGVDIIEETVEKVTVTHTEFAAPQPEAPETTYTEFAGTQDKVPTTHTQLDEDKSTHADEIAVRHTESVEPQLDETVTLHTELSGLQSKEVETMHTEPVEPHSDEAATTQKESAELQLDEAAITHTEFKETQPEKVEATHDEFVGSQQNEAATKSPEVTEPEAEKVITVHTDSAPIESDEAAITHTEVAQVHSDEITHYDETKDVDHPEKETHDTEEFETIIKDGAELVHDIVREVAAELNKKEEKEIKKEHSDHKHFEVDDKEAGKSVQEAIDAHVEVITHTDLSATITESGQNEGEVISGLTEDDRPIISGIVAEDTEQKQELHVGHVHDEEVKPTLEEQKEQLQHTTNEKVKVGVSSDTEPLLPEKNPEIEHPSPDKIGEHFADATEFSDAYAEPPQEKLSFETDNLSEKRSGLPTKDPETDVFTDSKQQVSSTATYSTLFGSSGTEPHDSTVVYGEHNEKHTLPEEVPETFRQETYEISSSGEYTHTKNEHVNIADVTPKLQQEHPEKGHGIAGFISSAIPDSVQNLFSSTRGKFDLFEDSDSKGHAAEKKEEFTSDDGIRHEFHITHTTGDDQSFGNYFTETTTEGKEDGESFRTETLTTTTSTRTKKSKKHGLFGDKKTNDDLDFEFIH